MSADRSDLPWYREVSPAQWKAFLTTFAAWTLDAFDFTILTFVLIDIQNSFSVNKALAGLLGTVTLLFRVVGGIGAGTLADRYGRKGPILFSIAWYTLFAFLSGLSTSLRDALRVQGVVRHRYGRHVGGGHAAGVGAVARALAWHRVRHPAGGLLYRAFCCRRWSTSWDTRS